MRTIAVVPHTHWDREWYQPFQAFRLRLVDLLDELLPRLERDPSYARFLLDGQMAVVDDYLAVRPDAEPALRRLAASGRLSAGPWYVLMDEFCVSGETMVRDLQLGLERATTFGGAMEVGYLPDMFGHVAQMPQLLRQAGFEHAVVWRGVPSAVDRTAFWWTAPDGSTVRAEHLWVGYGNGAAMPDDAKALLRRIRAHERELGAALPDQPGAPAPILWMNGTDHQPPQPWLGRVVAEVNDLQDDYRVVVTSLPEYLADAPTEGLPSWTGELRSGARANLLMGVLSNRVDVKQAAARVERALERQAEPLCALFLPAERWPATLLRTAWVEVVRNAAHDSVCACSVDEVGAAVLHRYAEAEALARGLRRQGLRALGASMAEPGVVVVNPSARARSGLVELALADPKSGDIDGAQVLDARDSSVEERTMTGRELSMFIGQLRNTENESGCDLVGVLVQESGDELDVVLRTGVGRGDMTTGAATAELYAQAGARKQLPVQVRVEREAYRRVLARVDDMPGFGWRTCKAGGAARVAPVEAGGDGLSLANGLVRVDVDRADGTFAIDGVRGFDQLVDEADAGDSYNFSPPATGGSPLGPIALVDVAVDEVGPLRGRLRVRRRWSEGLQVDTVVELRAGERLVRVTATLDNRAGDHRLRTWFPLPEPATSSRAECAFAVVERGLTAEGGLEHGLPTFPSRRFVTAGGLTVVHEGLLEYELVDVDDASGRARALALTLLRCTGVISGTDLAYRPDPAGPPIAAPACQMLGRHTVRYAVHVGPADPYALVDDAFLPLELVRAGGGGTRPPDGTALDVDGAEVSALRRTDGGALELRVFNPTDADTTVRVASRSGWLVDLRGRPLEPFDGSFPLRPWGIATCLLSD